MNIAVFLVGVATIWLFCGLSTAIICLGMVGGFIADKYGCGIFEGIARFERADTMKNNLLAVGCILLTWPSGAYGLLMSADGQEALREFVYEHDYD